MSRHLLIMGLLFFQFAAAQKKAECKEPVKAIKLLEAAKQDWISGAPGGGSGTTYSFKIHILTDKKIEFKNIWLGSENVLFDVGFYSTEVNKKIQQGDSVLLTYNHVNARTQNQDTKSETTNSKRPPLDYKGVALIEYTLGGNARYYVVKSFKQLAPLKGQ